MRIPRFRLSTSTKQALRSPSLDPVDQVAAVCFQARQNGFEFLLVRTGNGRWTFPKGRSEPGLTRAQSAALEAFEEAGVHGRIEEASFARYSYRKRRTRRSSSDREELMIHAHLCEVCHAESPQESKRDPKWFSAQKAKRKLREGRTARDGAELARVIDLAIIRLQRMPLRTLAAADNLKKVKFDAFEIAGTPGALQHATVRRYIRREPTTSDQWRTSRRRDDQRMLTGKVLALDSKRT